MNSNRPLYAFIVPLVAGVLMATTPAIPRLLAPHAVYDPLWARGVLAGLCLSIAAQLYLGVSPRFIRPVGFVLGVFGSLWCGLILWGNNFPPGYSAGVFIVLAAAVVGSRRVIETLAYVALITAVVLVAGWFTSTPGVPPVAFAGHLLATGLILSASTLARSQLVTKLRQARSDLERQVEARTSELHREIAERREAELRATAASEAKSRFLANMSHELRTPLNVILGYGELIAEEVADGVDPADLIADLERSNHAARALLRIIDDILDLTRIEAGVLALHVQRVEVAPLVREVVAELAPLVAEGVECRVEVPGLVIDADPGRFRQVVINLLSNAARFTTQGRITVSGRAVAEAVEIAVTDTGPGIPEEALSTLFDRFTQVDESSTREHGGTGLGLALSRELAEQMGGSLAVTSELGSGSTFTIRLPRHAEERDQSTR